MQWLEETVVIGSVAIALSLIYIGEADKALGVFGAIIGYVFGRAQKVNGALTELVNSKKL